jgi:Family of unknown function (DUF6788)
MSISKKFNELITLLQAGPVLPGGIRKAFETCGQPNCKCKRVNAPQLHGPYNTLSFSLKEKSSSMSLSQSDALLAEEMTERFKKAKVLLNETVNLKDAVMLGCSDIIESIFGKYKWFSAKSP